MKQFQEVAPPGWGHTKSDKEKGVEKGGSAAAFDRARKEGRFKGSKEDMFKLMWWMKNKGGKPKGKPHYKPGTDEKYKKYQDVDEARTIRSKEDAEKARQQRDNPDEWVVRNKGGGHHGLNRKSALKGQAKRRSGNLKSISKKELEDHGKRNLHKDWKSNAAKAMKTEVQRKKTQRAEAQKKSKETGKQHDVDHIQGQANRKKHTDRWHKIHPGDSSDNRRVISQSDNLKKNSKDSGGKKITRSSAIKRALSRVRSEDWKPEIEHSKLGDAVKKKREKKRKEAESSLPPHLRLDVMKKAFAHTNESVVLDANTKIKNVRNEDYYSGQGEKIQKRTLAWMKKKGQKGAPGLDAMKARTAEHKAKRGVKEGQAESFEIDKAAHKKVQKKAKLRNLAKGNMNPNEKAAAEKKAGGPKLAFEGWQEKAKEAMKKVVGKKKEERKASMDSTTSKLHDLRKEKFKSEKQKEHEKYVNFLDADD